MQLFWSFLVFLGFSTLPAIKPAPTWLHIQQLAESNNLPSTHISAQHYLRFDQSTNVPVWQPDRLTDFSNSVKPKEPVIEWITDTEHEFGDLPQHKDTTATFTFKNITDEPMTIDAVRVSCGCTVPDWSLRPIAPDSVGVIKIVYDSEKAGYFRKKVRVFVSAQRWSEKIYISGFVE